MRRALLIEDEVMVAMYVEDLLREAGYQVVALGTTLDHALVLARTASFDFAVLDINLAGKVSFPVAAILRERGIPFLFASGYASRGLIEEYSDAVRTQKPFCSRDLTQAIDRILTPGAPTGLSPGTSQ